MTKKKKILSDLHRITCIIMVIFRTEVYFMIDVHPQEHDVVRQPTNSKNAGKKEKYTSYSFTASDQSVSLLHITSPIVIEWRCRRTQCSAHHGVSKKHYYPWDCKNAYEPYNAHILSRYQTEFGPILVAERYIYINVWKRKLFIV